MAADMDRTAAGLAFLYGGRAYPFKPDPFFTQSEQDELADILEREWRDEGSGEHGA